MAETFAQFVKEQEGQEQEAKETTTKETTETTTQETTQPPTGQEGVKEDVVMIGGKPRPLKNYEAELRRKFDKEKEDELSALRSTYEQRQAPQQTQPVNFIDQVYAMAENEIATTGKAVPIQTIMQVANSISLRNTEYMLTSREQARRAVSSFKKSVKAEPDWRELEDDFDELVEQLKPEQINPPTLEVIVNAVRGKKAKELLAQAKAKAKEEAEKDTTIVGGEPAQKTSGGHKPSSGLTPEQKQEMDRMNQDTTMEWTEGEYIKALKKKQERFKLDGAKNIPQLFSDLMVK